MDVAVWVSRTPTERTTNEFTISQYTEESSNRQNTEQAYSNSVVSWNCFSVSWRSRFPPTEPFTWTFSSGFGNLVASSAGDRTTRASGLTLVNCIVRVSCVLPYIVCRQSSDDKKTGEPVPYTYILYLKSVWALLYIRRLLAVESRQDVRFAISRVECCYIKELR